MSGRKSASSNHSVTFIKSTRKDSIALDAFSRYGREDYVRTTLTSTPDDKTRLASSVDGEKEIESSSKMISLCTMCGRYKGFRMRRKLFVIACIALILLMLSLGVVLTFYAIVPAIVRSTIEKAELSFRSINIEEIKNDSFRLRATLEVSRTGSIAATILSPLVIDVDHVGIVRNEQPIAITGGGDTPTVVPIDSPFVVSDLTAFYAFTRSLIFQPNVIWHLTAKASIQPISSAMPVYSNIPFDKKVTLNALNGLPNVTIQSISLLRSNAQHVFADIIIDIPNPSMFTIDLGALQFTLRYNNLSIGYVQSIETNITLHPGANAIAFSGELQSKSSESFAALSVVIQNYLTRKSSRVGAVAGPNATSYSLLAAGMEGLSLAVQMPPFGEQLIPSLAFNSMSLVPSTTDKKVTLSASITIKINSPLGQQSPLQIKTMGMSIRLFYVNSPVGMLDVSQVPVQQLDVAAFESAFESKELTIADTGKAYERFARDFINANKTHPIKFRVVGLASITGAFALGPLDIDGIPVDNEVSLVGLEGLGDVRVHGISVDGEQENALQLAINATIGNPGVTDVRLRDFTLAMVDRESGTVLGRVPIDVLDLQPGYNTLLLNGLLAPNEPSDLPVVGKFFSAYLNGHTQQVVLFHEYSTANNPTGMDLTVSGLSIVADLDGIATQLIRRVQVLSFGIEFDRADVSRVYVTGQLLVLFELPSNVRMTFKALTTSIDFTMRFNNGSDMGQMILSELSVDHNQLTNELSMSFDRQELHVLDGTSFEDFAADLVLTDGVSVTIAGFANASAEVRIGNITLTDVPVSDTVRLTGYDRFDHGRLSIDEVDLTRALSANELALRVRTIINNPSTVYILDGGRLSLDLREATSGTSLGLVIIDPFSLEAQGNETLLKAEGTFTITPNNSAAAQQFISRMVSGMDNEVELRGMLPDGSVGSSVPLLSKAIAGLNIRTRVPGLTGEKALVREVLLKKLSALQISGIPFGLVKTLSARIRLKNPFSAPLTVTSMNIRADYGALVNQDQQVGLVAHNSPIPIDAHQEILTLSIDVKITAKLTTMVSLLGPLLAGVIPLSLTGTIDVLIDNQLALKNLPLTLLNVTSTQEASF